VIATLQYKNTCLRVAIGMLLIFLIGFKTLAPLFAANKVVDKEIKSSAENDDTDGEKKAENAKPLEKELANILISQQGHIIWHNDIKHQTGYYNHYQSSYYNKITIPPPDQL
jgi:hypothetical protein